jgi:hypothetical protein
LPIAFKELLESVRSELVLGYLDDVAMGGEAMCLLKDFLHLETVGEKVGLELNRSKFEVIGHHRDTGSYGINLSETSTSAIFLGAPLLAGWPTPRFGVEKEAS